MDGEGLSMRERGEKGVQKDTTTSFSNSIAIHTVLYIEICISLNKIPSDSLLQRTPKKSPILPPCFAIFYRLFCESTES